MSRNQSPRVPATPTEIEIMRDLVAQGKSASEIAAILGRTKSSVIHNVNHKKLGPWLRKPGKTPRDLSIIPPNFALFWQTKTQKQLGRHYAVSNMAIAHWVRALGLKRPVKEQPPKYPPVASRRSARGAPCKTKNVSGVPGHKYAPFSVGFRDASAPGQAADTLRRDGWKVHRCNAAGIYDPAGSMWQCGRLLITTEELIERADRLMRKAA